MSRSTDIRQAQVLGGRMGGWIARSRHDASYLTSAARQKFLTRFESEVDPQLVLDPEERNARARAARKAYFTKLALLSAQARAGGRKSSKNHSATTVDAAVAQHEEDGNDVAPRQG
ncbi:MAG: hypothetical protein NVS3B24_21300 [Candidatus Dormibacteria bacterium]